MLGSADSLARLDANGARKLADIHRTYPWLATATKWALASIDAPDDLIEKAANSDAERRSLRVDVGAATGVGSKPKKKKRGWWSGITDTLGKADDTLYSLEKATVRSAFEVLQAPAEGVDWVVRDAAATVRKHGWLGLLEGKTSGEGIHAEDFTLGAHLKGNDVGSGYFPAGEAHEAQARAARRFGTIDGHAITLGRLAASTVVQPGTKPYQALSALIDATMDTKFDPSAIAFGRASTVVKQARGLTNVIGEADVVKAAAKAPEEWRQEVEQVAGLVSLGHRNTVVPAAVDKFLFSDDVRKVVREVAEEPSAVAIYRKFKGKIPAETARELADATDDHGVLEVLRPALGLGIDPSDVRKFTRPQVISSATRQVRAFGRLPDTFLPLDDPDALIRNLDNSLLNAGVKGAKRDGIVEQAFRTVVGVEHPDEALFNLADVASTAIRESMVAHGADPELARDLTRWTGKYVRQARYLADPETAQPVNLPFLHDAEGNPILGWKPSALHQLLNRGVPLYDPAETREIRQLSSAFTKIGAHSKTFQVPLSMIESTQNGLWKLVTMVRPAYFIRVNGEEVIRANANAVFDSVPDYLMYVFGRRGAGGSGGGPFDLMDEVDDIEKSLPGLAGAEKAAAEARLAEIHEEFSTDMNAFYAAMARPNPSNMPITPTRFKGTGITQSVDRSVDPSAWQRGAAEQIIKKSTDPILRRVANRGLLAGDETPNPLPGMDGIRDWLMHGTGRPFLARMEAAFPDVDWSDPVIVDRFLDIQETHVLSATGDADDLRQAIATGHLNGSPIAGKAVRGRREATDALKERLATFVDEPTAPRTMDAEVLERRIDHPLARGLEAQRTISNAFFGHLYGGISDTLARAPVFKGNYYRWVEEHFGWLSAEGRDEAIAQARRWGIGENQIGRLEERAARMAPGNLSLKEADAFAKGYALDATNDLLFDSSQRGQFFDIHRILFPFGEAWKEVTTRWAKTLFTNPKILRRSQQIVTAARGADLNDDGVGFFHKDPVTGEEMFSFGIDAPFMDALGLRDSVRFEGSVQGLSLGTSVMPGVGPVGQFSLAAILPDVPDTDFIAKLLFPYGEPDTTAEAATTILLPAWAKKGLEAWNADERKDVVYANTLAEMVRVLGASGKYGNSEDEINGLMHDARDKARVVTGFRALLQMVAPSAPSPKFFADVEGGDQVSGILFRRYAELQEDENNGKVDSAIGSFLDEFGDQAFVYLVGKTKSAVGGQGASSAYGRWERTHDDFVSKYPQIAGYFGPADEGFDSTVYGRQLRSGRRDRRDTRQSLRDAQQTVGSWMWREAREQAGPNPGKKRRAWLRDVRDQIKSEYPAWNPNAFPAGQTDAAVEALGRAAEDDAVKDTPLAGAIRQYMEARSMAQQAAIDRGYGESDKAFATSKRAANLRAWLRQGAAALTEEVPEFGRVFDSVLDSELNDDTED